MLKSKYLVLVCLISLCLCSLGQAQGLKGKLRSKAIAGSSNSSDRNNQRNDFEGTVWEYKIIDRTEKDKSKQTRMVGRIRVKQSAVFAVGGVEVIESQSELNPAEQAEKYIQQFDRNGDDQLDASELTKLLRSMQKNDSAVAQAGNRVAQAGNKKAKPAANGSQGNLKGDLKGLLSQRINGAKEEGTGSERVGDLSKQSVKNCVFTFDQDDSYPLSGRVEVKPDTSKKGGVWSGNYYEYSDGKQKERWFIEMRKIDE